MGYLVFFLCFTIALIGYQYDLVIGSMFKNEARYLKEWIEYHRLIGVEHFYLYNNDSSDNYQEVLEPYIKAGLVDLFNWNSKTAPSHEPTYNVFHVGFQHSAFHDALQRSLGVSKWVALIDLDEFLFPSRGIEGINDFRDFLNNAPQDIGTVYFGWMCYGTSNVWEMAKEALVIETFLWREKGGMCEGHTKCIHRPEGVAQARLHESSLKEGYKKIVVPAKTLRINHYCCKDQKTVLAKRFHNSWSALRIEEARYNVYRDDSILPFVQLLKKAMANSP